MFPNSCPAKVPHSLPRRCNMPRCGCCGWGIVHYLFSFWFRNCLAAEAGWPSLAASITGERCQVHSLRLLTPRINSLKKYIRLDSTGLAKYLRATPTRDWKSLLTLSCARSKVGETSVTAQLELLFILTYILSLSFRKCLPINLSSNPLRLPSPCQLTRPRTFKLSNLWVSLSSFNSL
jgi:hypothetical protein